MSTNQVILFSYFREFFSAQSLRGVDAGKAALNLVKTPLILVAQILKTIETERMRFPASILLKTSHTLNNEFTGEHEPLCYIHESDD